jgi:hypothetical protein
MVSDSQEEAKHDDQEDVIFVLNDETDEPRALECGDTLPPLTETGDTIDTDNPIQYTREQLLFHILNTLTYKVKVIDRAHWIRIASEFVDLMLSGDDRPFPQSVVPIVKGRRVVVADADAAEDAAQDADEADAVVHRATMATLLQQRIPQGAPPFKDNLKRLYHVERIFADGIDSLGVPTVTFKVPFKMRAHLYSSDRRVTLFPPTNLYEGDTVEVVGFVFGDGEDPVQFDPEQYRRSLAAMSVGDRVLIWPHDGAKSLGGTVLEREGDTLKVGTGSRGAGEYLLRVDEIWKNQAFVYPEGSQDLLSRATALSRGAVTTLLQGDADGSLTLQTIMPALADVLRFSRETMISLDDAKRVGLEAQIAARFEDMDTHTLDALSGILAASVNAFQFPASPSFDTKSVAPAAAGPVTVTLPDLGAFNYTPYVSEGTFADSDLNRLKHMFGQGDDGMVYMLHNVGQSVDRVLHGIRKHSAKIFSGGAWGGAGACEGDPHEKLAQRAFASWAEMEAYTDAPLGEVVELGSTLYVRFRASNGDHVWVRHVSQPKQAVCSGSVDFKSIAQMSRLPCAYDDYDQVCASAEALRQQNEIRNNDLRAAMLSKARALHEKRGEHKAAIAKWMAQVARTGEAKIGTQFVSQEDVIDYSTFSGDPEQIDFEDMYNKRESTVFYAPLRPVDSNSAAAADSDGDPYVSGLARALGLKLPAESIALIAKNLHSRFSGEEALPSKLEALRQAVHRKAMAELARQLKSETPAAKATRDALIARAKAWEEQTYAKKKKELEEKITGKGQKVLYACALIAIMSQIAGTDLRIEFVHPKCAKTFSAGMVAYVACAARVLVDTDAFGGVAVSQKDLETEVEGILKTNAQMANAYLASRTGGERSGVQVTQWPQFRPVLGAADEHLKAVRNKRAGLNKKGRVGARPVLNLAPTKKKVAGVDVKPIAFKQVFLLKRPGTEVATPKKAKGLPADLAEAVGNNSAAFWDRFTDRTYNLFDILSAKLPLDAAAVSAVSQFAFHPTQDNALHTRNVMRAFLDNELKSLLGKVANRWKGSNSAGEEDTVALILQIEAISGLADELASILQQVSQGALASVGALEASDTVRSLYMLDYVLVYTLYSIAAIVNKNKMDTLTLVEVVRAPKARFDAVMAVCNLVLRRCAAALKRNTFVTAEILHTHEVLREERKEKIIQGAERLHGEDKKTFLEATKLGLFTWEDLPQEDATQGDEQRDPEIDRNEYWVMDEDDDEDYNEGGNGEFD